MQTNRICNYFVLNVLLMLFGIAGHLQAATVTISSSIPTIDGADIANDNGTVDANADGDYGHMWSNRPHQGQSFLTGSNPGGYTLSAVTMKNLNNTITNSPTFNVLVGTLTTDGSPEVFTQIGSTETGTAPNYAPLNYITFTFDTPLTLNANTTYAFLWGSNGSGFVTVNNLNNATYSGGTGISSGDNNVPDLNNVLLRNVDRVFHLDMAAIPEPSTLTLGTLGLLSLLGARRRRTD